MSVSQVGIALKIGRTARRMKQGKVGPCSQSLISMIEAGERAIAPDVAPMIATNLDHPALYFELQRDITGGVGPAWLNGPNVDLHRSAVREKTQEEFREAMESIERFNTNKPPSAETQQERAKRKDHLLQVLDSIQAACMYVAVQCEEYGFSMKHLSHEHYEKLRSKRYVTA